ncbi:MAG TPA: chaperonin GroEL [Polyangiaceae bacterium]|nr:chaperonin GroEL [Polyangiaceae bacterium]
MVVRSIAHGLHAQRSILRGVDALANAVRVTLGPRGRNVVLERPGEAPRFTKDGVTVALEVEVADSLENVGAELVRQVASKTAAAAGDGTTTAIVLAQALCHEGMKLVAAGHHALALKRGLEQGLVAARAELLRMSRPVGEADEIRRVAALSANGDTAIGELVAAALEKVGKDGVVSVIAGEGVETTTDAVRGLQFERGYLSPYFITDPERVECVLEDAWILVCDQAIRGVEPLVPILEAVLESKKPLLVIAEDLDEHALATLVLNKARGTLACCAVKSPSLGVTRLEHLRDLAVVTGATIVSSETGLTLPRLRLEDLGRCTRVVVQPDVTTLVGGAGDADATKTRVAMLTKELQRLKDDKRSSKNDVTALEQRVRRLTQGVAIVKVGGRSHSELEERKDRVEDALCATQAAIAEGVVPGGGIALLRCEQALDALRVGEGEGEGEQALGVAILRRALSEPLRRIAQNAGEDGTVVVEKVRAGTGAFGWDAARREYCDLQAAGVLDATKVVQSALECAVNVVGLMLTTQAILVRKYQQPVSFTPYRPDLYEDDDDDYA